MHPSHSLCVFYLLWAGLWSVQSTLSVVIFSAETILAGLLPVKIVIWFERLCVTMTLDLRLGSCLIFTVSVVQRWFTFHNSECVVLHTNRIDSRLTLLLLWTLVKCSDTICLCIIRTYRDYSGNHILTLISQRFIVENWASFVAYGCFTSCH